MVLSLLFFSVEVVVAIIVVVVVVAASVVGTNALVVVSSMRFFAVVVIVDVVGVDVVSGYVVIVVAAGVDGFVTTKTQYAVLSNNSCYCRFLPCFVSLCHSIYRNKDECAYTIMQNTIVLRCIAVYNTFQWTYACNLHKAKHCAATFATYRLSKILSI